MQRSAWKIVTLLIVMAVTSWSAAQAQEVPKGELLKFSFAKSKVFPGTTREVTVADKDEDSGADGVRTDRDGRVWVATRLGLQVCDQPGRVNCIIPTPNGKVSNLTFGGENFDTLYATCGDRVYSRKVKVQGANGWQAPIKPAKPGL